ncbi:MAG: hypothetical protein R3F49_19145 [Planctomycetota bacterium]
MSRSLVLPVLLTAPLAAVVAWRAVDGLPADPAQGAAALRVNLAHVAALEVQLAFDPAAAGVPPAIEHALAGYLERWQHVLPGLALALPRADAGADAGARAGEGLTAAPAARLVIGGLTDARIARLLTLAGLACELDGEASSPAARVRLAGQTFERAGFALACAFMDPERPGLPVFVVAGDAAPVAAVLRAWGPSCAPRGSVWSFGARALDVDLAPRGGARWQSTLTYERGGAAGPREPGPTDAAGSQEQAAELRAAVARCAAFLPGFGEGRELPPLDLEPTLEPCLGGPLGDGLSRYTAPTAATRYELGAWYQPALAGRPARLRALEGSADVAEALLAAWLEDALGAPREAWMLAGAAVDGAGELAARQLAEWGDVLGLPLYGAARGASPFQALDAVGGVERRARAGLLFRALRRTLGSDPTGEALRRAWREGLDAPTRARVEVAYRALVADQAPAPPRTLLDAAGGAVAGATGVTLTAPPRPAPRGHGTRAAADSLARLAALGAGAALVTMHVVVPRDTAPNVGGLGAPYTLESDVAIAATVAALRARGMLAVLVVQPLTSPTGLGPCDTSQLGSVELWETALQCQARAVRHAACVARAARADALCIARGAPQFFATSWRGEGPEPAGHVAFREAKERGWRALVDAGRLAGVPLVALAPDLGFAAGMPVGEELAWVGVDLAPRFVAGGEAPPPADSRGPWTPLLRARFQQAALERAEVAAAVVVGFPAASSVAFGPARTGGRAEPGARDALLGALAEAAGPTRPGKGSAAALGWLFLRSWALDGRTPPRSEDLSVPTPDAAAALKRAFAR